jgi:hypothetical protein
MKTVTDALGVARSNLAVQTAPSIRSHRPGRPPQPDAALLDEIKAIIADLSTYGYRRVHALLRRRREQTGLPAVNVKRVYRVMKTHGLLLQRHSGAGIERRHDGRVAVDPIRYPLVLGRVRDRLRQTASGCASPSRSTAATARRSPGFQPTVALTAATSAI